VPVVEKEVKIPQGSSLLDSFIPPAAEESPKIVKDDKPLDKASIMVSAIDKADDDLQRSFEVISPSDPQEKDKDEIVEDLPLQMPIKPKAEKPAVSDSVFA